jgi:hypothetical protein
MIKIVEIEKKQVKKGWQSPTFQIIPFKNTRNGENQTFDEDTAGQGYDPTPS